MIKIIKMTKVEYDYKYFAQYEMGELWDYPVEELGHILEENDGKVFALIGNRLYETPIDCE